MAHRIEQVSAQLQELCGQYLEAHLELRGVLVTITDVDVSSDLSTAHLLVSVLPESARGTALFALRKLLPGFKKSLYRKLSLRVMPQLDFAIDNREARAAELDRLLSENS